MFTPPGREKNVPKLSRHLGVKKMFQNVHATWREKNVPKISRHFGVKKMFQHFHATFA